MSTTVIPTLDPSESPRSPILFQSCGLHQSAENDNSVRMKEVSDTWEASENSSPMKEDTSNCTLDLPMDKIDWNAKESSYSEENSFVCEASSFDEDAAFDDVAGNKTMPVAPQPENFVLNLSLNSQNEQPSSSRDEEPCSSENTGIANVSVKVEFEESASTEPENISALSVKAEIETDTSSAPENVIALSVKAEIETDASSAPENVSTMSVKEEMETDDENDNPGRVETATGNTEKGGLKASSLDSSVANILEVDYNALDTEINNVIVSRVSNCNYSSGSNDTISSISDVELRTEESTDVINVSEAEVEDVINVTATTEDNVSNSLNSPEQEVVDVESYQPCVVDLTCEEEDDVDVVAVVEPVIFIGTESRRRNRRRTPSPQIPDPEDFERIGDDHDHGNILDDDTNNNAVNEGNEDLWGVLNPTGIDLQNPNLTFGSLLEQAHVETVDDNQIQPPRSPVIRRPQRELRRSRRQRRSRSRSPVIFAMDLEDNQPHIANLVHAINHIIPEEEWPVPMDVPNQLPLDANPLVGRERNRRIAQVPPPRPPASPPHMEQPTITCLVCLDSIATINSSSRSLCSTVCGHVFCSACIKEVVKQRKQCPVCRKRLTKKQYHPLFI
ncbi:uncharacterized protein [Palaemon carinicauda]|uniref:uncharacterized protein n=1 Tax=Palaemon carinicauda TaxID=392227 RepID=UPI0035B5F2EE